MSATMTEAVEAAARATHSHLYNDKLRDGLRRMTAFISEAQVDEQMARKRAEVEAKAAATINAALPILRKQFAEEAATAIRAERNAHIGVGTQAFGAMTQAAAIAHDCGKTR